MPIAVNRKKLIKRSLYIVLVGLLMGILFTLGWIYGIEFRPLKTQVKAEGLQFSLAADLPQKVTEAGGTATDGKFFMVGGIGPLANTYNAFYGYYPEKDHWEKLPDFPEKINHPGVTGHEKKVFVVGGFDPIGIRLRGFMFADWKPKNTFYIFDLINQSWSEGPPLPEARGAGGVCYYDSCIYYVGGINPEKALSQELFQFDFRTNTWTSLPPMPTPRDHLRMEAVDGKLFAISGRKDDLRFNLKSVECFDLESQVWSKKADIPIGRGGLGSTVFQNKIYTFGGEHVWSCFDLIECYDPKTDTWTTIGKLPEPRHGICAGVINDTIHLVSGGMRPRISISEIHRTLSFPN